MQEVLILMGSIADKEWGGKIRSELGKFGINSILRVASAHKIPEETIKIVKETRCDVIITVAGRSNALSGLVDACTTKPVIACPPLTETTILYDLYSTVRMPSGVAPLLILSPEGAAIAAAKIIGVSNSDVRESVKRYQEEQRKKIVEADEELQNG